MSGSTPSSSGASSVLTHKGDIVGFDTARKRIGVGINDQVLTADSTNVNGLAWKDTSGSSEYSTLSGGGITFTPTKQTGITSVTVDNENGTAGQCVLTVDGSTNESISSGQIKTRIVNPTTSLSISTSHDFGIANKVDNGWANNINFTTFRGMCFSDDGVHLFINGHLTWFQTHHYTCSTPFDVTTCTFQQGLGGSHGGSWWGDRSMDYVSSTKLLSFSGSTLTMRTLSTPNNITTASTHSSLATGLSSGRSCCLSTTGDKVCAAGYSGSVIKVWEMSTPYDLSTASYDHQTSFSPSGIIIGMRWNDDGSIFAIWSNHTIKVYSCATNFDISSMTELSSVGYTGGYNYEHGFICPASVARVYSGTENSKMQNYSFDTGYAGTARVKVG